MDNEHLKGSPDNDLTDLNDPSERRSLIDAYLRSKQIPDAWSATRSYEADFARKKLDIIHKDYPSVRRRADILGLMKDASLAESGIISG